MKATEGADGESGHSAPAARAAAGRRGNVIPHHRTVNPVLVREWSTPMEAFAGAIWQSRRTTKRFTKRFTK